MNLWKSKSEAYMNWDKIPRVRKDGDKTCKTIGLAAIYEREPEPWPSVQKGDI